MGKASNKKKEKRNEKETVYRKKSFLTKRAVAYLALIVLTIGATIAMKYEWREPPAIAVKDGVLSVEQREQEIQKRKPLMDEAFVFAQEIVDKTQDEDAKAVLEYLQESAFLCAPYPHPAKMATIVLESGNKNSQTHLGIVPLANGDQKISNAWSEAYEAKTVSAFTGSDQFPMIILGSQINLPQIWKGLIFLHEGNHALAHAAGIADDIDDELLKRAIWEFHAYQMEVNLISKLFDKAYEKVLEQEIRRLEMQYKIDEGIIMPDFEAAAANLVGIFGPVQSHIDEGVRGSILWIHAVFRILEKHYPEDPTTEKINFLWTMYKDGNLH
jgi:hypothetical protein